MRDIDVLNFIKSYIEEKKFPPTIREIADGCDMSSTSVVTYYLNKLEDSNRITRYRYTSRGIVINE